MASAPVWTGSYEGKGTSATMASSFATQADGSIAGPVLGSTTTKQAECLELRDTTTASHCSKSAAAQVIDSHRVVAQVSFEPIISSITLNTHELQ